MRTRQRAAHGAALLYVLTALPALASCPTADDMGREGVRFVGQDGYDVVHRYFDPGRVEIDYIEAAAPEAWISRSILIHGVYIQWFGSIDSQGQLEDGSAGFFARETPMEAMPVPAPGVTWEGAHMFQADGDTPVSEVSVLTTGTPTQWQLGACTFDALPVDVETTSADGHVYTERMMYLADLQTAVLVDYIDNDGSSPYVYVNVYAEGGPVPDVVEAPVEAAPTVVPGAGEPAEETK